MLYEGLLDDDKTNKEVPTNLLLLKQKRGTSVAPPNNKKVAVSSSGGDVPALPSSSIGGEVEDLYDPSQPNSYEQMLRVDEQAERKKREEQKKTQTDLGKELLKKAGWKEGETLGRRGYGLVRPIDGFALAQGKESVASLLGSRVLAIKNACGAGDVDVDLLPDIESECEKYGHVVRCKVWEADEEELDHIPAPQHVRVYVEFHEPSAATKAKEALDKRFFGGRKIEVEFYSAEAFASDKLRPPYF